MESQGNDLNSPPKRNKLNRNDDNIDLSVNGAGFSRAEPAMAVAPVA